MTSLRNHLGVLFGIGAAALAGIVLFARSAPSGLSAADVNVSCGLGQRAIVRQTISAGVPQVSVDCVQGAAVPATYLADPFVGVIPAVYTLPVQGRSLVNSAAPPVRRVSTTAARSSSVARRSTSWQRKALVIGGSTGVGAGVGALVGGKKGALIGAAIGGGGAALVQAVRER